MGALEDLGKNRSIVWDDLFKELREEAHSEITNEEIDADLDALYSQAVELGILYPAGIDRQHRVIWHAQNYKTIEFVIREFLANRRLAKEGENVRIQSGL